MQVCKTVKLEPRIDPFTSGNYPRQMGPPGSAGSGGITEQRLSFLLPARTTGYHRQISDLQPDYALYRLYISLYNPEI